MDKLEELKQEVHEMEMNILDNQLDPTQLENFSNRLDEIIKEGIDTLLELTKNTNDGKVSIDKMV